jgi:hypothetical protein
MTLNRTLAALCALAFLATNAAADPDPAAVAGKLAGAADAPTDSLEAMLADPFALRAMSSSNDNFASAITLSSGIASQGGNTATDTIEAGEPLACGGSPIGHTVWYRFTPASSGTMSANTYTSHFDTVLAVYRGASLATLTQVTCNDDDGSGGYLSSLQFTAFAGTTYYVQLGGWSASAGVFALNTAFSSSCGGNDDWSNACNVGFPPYSNPQVTTGTGLQFSEQAPSCGSGVDHTVWYTYTAPLGAPATRTADTIGSNFDTVLDVWLAPSGSPVASVGCNDDASGVQSSLSFNAVSGMTYLIRVGGYSGASGNLQFNIN